jgi:hypothetical protein
MQQYPQSVHASTKDGAAHTICEFLSRTTGLCSSGIALGSAGDNHCKNRAHDLIREVQQEAIWRWGMHFDVFSGCASPAAKMASIKARRWLQTASQFVSANPNAYTYQEITQNDLVSEGKSQIQKSS